MWLPVCVIYNTCPGNLSHEKSLPLNHWLSLETIERGEIKFGGRKVRCYWLFFAQFLFAHYFTLQYVFLFTSRSLCQPSLPQYNVQVLEPQYFIFDLIMQGIGNLIWFFALQNIFKKIGNLCHYSVY